MIKQISESKKLKKITMATAAIVMGVGLITSMSSFDGTGGGCPEPAGSGFGWDDREVTCPTSQWALVTTHTTSSGGGAVYVQAGHTIPNTTVVAGVSGYYNSGTATTYANLRETYKQCCVVAAWHYYCSGAISCRVKL